LSSNRRQIQVWWAIHRCKYILAILQRTLVQFRLV
jgi:hypothetical protein